MNASKPLRVYFVIGEESGDALGDDLLSQFEALKQAVEPMGLGGTRLTARGMRSLFDISDLSVMGISGVAARLPKLMMRVRETVKDILARDPDVLILVDSPEFAFQVAKQVKKKKPDLPVVKYVCPSVWAWRPGRARKLARFVDRILAILPFEPDVMRKLGGPETIYVGHPLSGKIPKIATASRKSCNEPPLLVLLPGSRRSEVSRLLPFIERTLTIFQARGNPFTAVLPAVEPLADMIRETVQNWPFDVEVVTGDDARQEAFKKADLALAASGTVTLEVALYKLPMISIYKLDPVAMRIRWMLTGWTASLPNLIADYPVVPERFNEYAHPEYVARMIERLCQAGSERQVQLDGFEEVIRRIRQKEPAALVAARNILEISGRPALTDQT